MIYEIKKDRFRTIHNLLDYRMDNIEIKAVIDGINPGWIFVDSIESPSTAMVWSKGIQGFYFVGNENNIEFNNYLNEFIDKEIRPRALREKLNRFEFSGETEKWDAVLERIFENRSLNKSRQFQYRFKYDAWDSYTKRKLEDNFTLKQIDIELLNDPDIKNLEFLSSEINRWWDSYEDYLDKTFGYCIVYENTIANYCITNFVYKDVHTMGIETLEDFRRKGLSQVTTEAYVENCIKSGLSPYWECMESNLASRSLTEKLGFYRNYIYTLYAFPFK